MTDQPDLFEGNAGDHAPDTEQVRERMRDLAAVIERHNRLYYDQAAPEISDREYDSLVHELETLETRHPHLAAADSPTRRVGGTPTEAFETVRHAVPMLSIANTYSPDELREFDGRVRRLLDRSETVNYVVELKIDGVSAALLYRDGRLAYGATRGNGVTGDVITANLLTLPQVRDRLRRWDAPANAALEVRGEVYMQRADFERMNEERTREGLEPFANPRNATAGSLKLLDPRLVARRPLRFFAYSVGLVENFPLPDTHGGLLERLAELGFPVNREWRRCAGIEAVLDVVNEWEGRRRGLPYDTDGLVIKVDERGLHETLGATSKAPRWLCAYKFSAEQAETRVRSIDVQVGRTGAVTPVAHLEPVFLAGSTVSRATLHNRDEVARKDVRVGDQVVIEKGGDIIPKVVRVLAELRTGAEQPFRYPEACPACGSPLVDSEEEVVVRCQNLACPAQIKERILHFASRGAMDIEGLGEKLVDQLVGKELVHRFSDLYRLDRVTLAGLDRMADKSAENLVAALDDSRSRPFAGFLFALGIRHIGQASSALLAEAFGSVERLRAASREELEAVEGVGAILAESVAAFFGSTENLEELERLAERGLPMELTEPEREALEARRQRAEEGANPVAGRTFVITGTLPTLKRPDAEKRIKAAGGKTSGSVSRNTDFVVAGEKAGSKLTKAETLGVDVIDEARLLEMLGET